MLARAYCRCNGGDYFVGTMCPMDGWSSPASVELADAVDRLARAGRRLSIEDLRATGVSEATLARTIVIDFGSAASAFDALTPRGYFVAGTWKPLHELGLAFI